MRIFIISIFFAFGSLLQAATVDTVLVYSESMKKQVKNVIILPNGYKANNQAYPTIYVLHGATGDYSNYVKKIPDFVNFADQYQCILICPDGGYTAWYFDSPVDPSMRYETYVANELVTWVDQHYPTIKKREKRAITGLSMGGHGAFYLGLRHQNIWGAIGSMSGGVDFRSFPNNSDLSKRLGTYAENKQNWEQNVVVNMLYLIGENPPAIIFDCGVSDFFIEVNRKLHDLMLYANIKHTYIERSGGHSWNYWAEALPYHFLFFNHFFTNSN